MIINATNEVAEMMKEDSLIILRSTVQIGTTRDIVRPILQKLDINLILQCVLRGL